MTASLILSLSCSGPRVGSDGGMGGGQIGSGGSQGGGGGGVAMPRPADRVFSIGLTNNAGGPPQSATVVELRFGSGDPDAGVVVAKKVSAPLSIDGDPADWASVPVSHVPMVSPGQAIGMSKSSWDTEWAGRGVSNMPYDFGITSVAVRAAWDDQYVYFLLDWEDATENRFRDDWVADGGAFVRVNDREDRAHFSFGISFPAFATGGCAAACHVKELLGEFSADAGAYRFNMHTNAPGELADVWSWRPNSSSASGLADDQYWNEIRRNADGPKAAGVSNRYVDAGIDRPLYMSELGVNSNPSILFIEDAGTPAAIPFDATGAQDGSRIPGYYYQAPSPARGQVQAVGKWSNGRWVVEWRRARTTTDTFDTQFPDVN